jgi:hypothetical protein
MIAPLSALSNGNSRSPRAKALDHKVAVLFAYKCPRWTLSLTKKRLALWFTRSGRKKQRAEGERRHLIIRGK